MVFASEELEDAVAERVWKAFPFAVAAVASLVVAAVAETKRIVEDQQKVDWMLMLQDSFQNLLEAVLDPCAGEEYDWTAYLERWAFDCTPSNQSFHSWTGIRTVASNMNCMP